MTEENLALIGAAFENTLQAAFAAHNEQLTAVYTERNRVVAMLASLYPAVVTRTTIEDWDSEWHNCVYIATPEGQMSWHFHDRDAGLFSHLPMVAEGVVKWDGHTTEEKYATLQALSRAVKLPFIALVDGQLKGEFDYPIPPKSPDPTRSIPWMRRAAGEWSRKTFGEAVFNSREERALRLLEEAMEFAQAAGVTAPKLARLAEQVYAKPAGDAPSELGDVMLTVMVAADSLDVDLEKAFLPLLVNVWENGVAICAKQGWKVIAEDLKYPHGRYPDADNMNGLE